VSGRGRPRKPRRRKEATGNPGKRPVKDEETDFEPAELGDIEPPAWLNKEAAAFWSTYAPMLAKEGLLTDLDVPEFAAACEQDAMYRRLQKRAWQRPFAESAGQIQRRARMALVERDRILARFGFTPSDREKINVKPKTSDPFEDFLSGKKPDNVTSIKAPRRRNQAEHGGRR
jgi:phage terminase small subunit